MPPLPACTDATPVGVYVAVIDDEEPILDATRSLLEQWGCTVLTAASGKQALAELGVAPRAPDAVICDYRLRGNENGIEVVTALRARFGRHLPALLITGDTGPTHIREIEASKLPVLHKPIEEDVLKNALYAIIDQRPIG